MGSKSSSYASPTNSVIRVRVWKTQKRPYRHPLPFSGYGASKTDTVSTGEVNKGVPMALGVVQGSEAASSEWARQAYALAYDRAMSGAKGAVTASVAANIAERKSSFDMITKRATQIHSAYRAIRKGDVRGFVTVLGFRKRATRKGTQWVRLGKGGRQFSIPNKRIIYSEKRFKRNLQDSGSLWLEYWFGWAPLLGDVYSAARVLSDDVPDETLRNVFRGTGKTKRVYSNRIVAFGGKDVQTDNFSADYMASVQFTVTSRRENADKARKLGLVNPASVAWEVVPFSWLVDWFIPVGRFLESYTDTVGFTYGNAFASTKRVCSRETTALFRTRVPTYWSTQTSQAYSFDRTIHGTLPIPGLFDRKGTLLSSWTRAATAISVLAGFLKRDR